MYNKIFFILPLILVISSASSSEHEKIKLNKISEWEIFDHKDVQQGDKSKWTFTRGKLSNEAHITIPKWLYKKNNKTWFGSNIVTKRKFENGTFHFAILLKDFRGNYGLLFGYENEENYCRIDLARELSSMICLKDGKIQRIKLDDALFYVPGEEKSEIDFVFDSSHFALYINGMLGPSFNYSFGKGVRFGFYSAGNARSFILENILFTKDWKKKRLPSIKILKQPYVHWCTKGDARISWETNVPGKRSYVKFKADRNVSIIDSKTTNLVHTAILTGLKPNQIYNYKCYTDGLFAGSGRFRSDPGKDGTFTFGLIGDNRTYPHNFKRLNELMAEEKPDIVLNVGDIVEQGLRSNWDYEFFKPNEIISNIAPYFISIGNHESNSRFFSYYLSYPDTNSLRGHYYAFTYGPVSFIAFDDYHLDDAQFTWLEEKLKSRDFTDASWRIVFSHQPAYSAGWSTYEGDLWKRSDKFLGLLKKYNVDFFFNGHTHSYERGLFDGIYHILSGGGGCGEEDWGRAWSNIHIFKLTLQYCIFHVAKDRIEMYAKEIDGPLLDHLIVERGKSRIHDAKPQILAHPDSSITGGKVSFLVSTPTLFPKMVRYKISYDKTVNTYKWTDPHLATDSVKLEITPEKSGKYSAEILAMDWDGRVTNPTTFEFDYQLNK